MPPVQIVHVVARAKRWPAVLVLVAAAVVAVEPALAAGPSPTWSIGIGAGPDRGHVDCVASFPCDRSDAAVKLFAGYALSDRVELQAVYFDAGRFKGGDTTPLGIPFGGNFKVSGVGLTGGYRWPVTSDWSLVGRAGVASVRTRFDYADIVADSVGKTIVQPLLGLGAAYAITPAVRIGLDYDATHFKAHETRGSLQTLGLVLQYSF